MDSRALLFIYSGILLLLLLFSIAAGKTKRYYNNLDKKEHPFRFMYPAAAFVYTKLKRIFRIRTSRATIAKIKRLSLKENVAEEVFLYTIQKIAVILTILLMVSILGALLCLSAQKDTVLSTLERNDFGQGEADYELNVSYEGEEETIHIVLDEQKYMEKEIHEKMDACAEKVRKEMLGDNLSAEYVTKPLKLIREYEGFLIEWEIEDPSVLDYNGDISPEVKANDRILLNLQAVFSMDDVSGIYTMPVVITAESPDKKAVLIEAIMESIKKDNSVYEKEVQLPEQLNGNRLQFRKPKKENAFLFLILGVIAALSVGFGYDRRLDQKLKKRNEQMMLDFAEIVSKLNLLYEAGLSIYKAWERIVEDQEKKHTGEEHFAYREMKLALEKMKNGMSERDAYREFGKRCGLHPYIKLGNILEQNLSKGTKGMKALLKQEVNDSFEERKRIAKKRGEEASTKLLLPMMIMLVIVIVIIAVPALMTMRL